MNQNLYDTVKNKELLAILTDRSDNVIWQSDASPVSAAYKDYFRGKFLETDGLILYANQLGMAFAVLASKINLKQCYAFQVSQPGLTHFQAAGIPVQYEEQIPLVRSSKDETKVCPIEQFLVDHSDPQERWKFLEERFLLGDGAPSCGLQNR